MGVKTETKFDVGVMSGCSSHYSDKPLNIASNYTQTNTPVVLEMQVGVVIK